MPSPDLILRSLTLIANQAVVWAVVWHGLIALALIAVLAGWRPDIKLAWILLAMPLVSLSVFAWKFGNPFNAVVFIAFAVFFILLTLCLENRSFTPARGWPLAVGAALVAFGWVYPHFLENAGWVKYLYAAPVGLIPCPTLAVVIGLVLMGGGLASRGRSLTLAGLGLFYGLFGTLRLHVWIDLGLIFGAAALAVQALGIRREQPRE